MCGIFGIKDKDNISIDIEILKKAIELLKHRGPDDAGMYYHKNIGLINTRLSILDLTEAGHQPMCNERKDIWIVHNGEIYNYLEIKDILIAKGYKFNSITDTEVIIHSYEEWGTDCLQYFNGIFAFAIWDIKRNMLFIARDRLGVKPLYYFWNSGRFIFSSEIKAILSSLKDLKEKLEVNWSAIYQYLKFRLTINNETFFKYIFKLMPGEYLVLKENNFKIEKYWDLPIEDYTEESFDEAKAHLRDLFEESIKLQLRSDVEVGAHLSGGIDSSSVVALVKKYTNSDLKTFSGCFKEGREYNEKEYIDEVTQKYEVKNYITQPNEDDFIESFPKIVWHMDEPMVGVSVFSQFHVNKLARKYVKVTLGGQGGDELFAGYYWYYIGKIKEYIKNFKLSDSKKTVESIYLGIKKLKIKSFIVNAFLIKNLYFNRFTKDILNKLKSSSMENIYPVGISTKNPIKRMMYWDIKYFLQALLHVEDRTSMAFSIESRVPLLDHRIVEFAFKLPYEYKVKKDITKYIFRESVKDLLPIKIYERKDKKGFPTPFDIWIRGKLKNYIEDIIFSNSFKNRGIYDSKFVKRIWQLQIKEHKNFGSLIWEMINIEQWFRTFVDKSV